ncbi:MAG: hypothetical protein GX205_07245 [Firmicutes bacterium]|nr:hypothetical protein [Bacillota bacterium]
MDWRWLIMLIPAAVYTAQLLCQPLSGGLVVGLGLLLLLVLAGLVHNSTRGHRTDPCSLATVLWSAVSAAGGALATYILGNYTFLGSAAASGLVGLAAAQLLCKYDLDLPAYAGVFVGMSSVVVVPSLVMVGIAGFMTGLLYRLVDGVFDGVGGRLGTMAAVSVLITLLLTGRGWG